MSSSRGVRNCPQASLEGMCPRQRRGESDMSEEEKDGHCGWGTMSKGKMVQMSPGGREVGRGLVMKSSAGCGSESGFSDRAVGF